MIYDYKNIPSTLKLKLKLTVVKHLSLYQFAKLLKF